ncbi:porin [Plesiomonas shigelloides]|uniref:porin n=1 Tax=Plesiomonas shigelloides TaxID=703 RepID=UPI000D1319BE|nr:porin [Plesiomonas shigelloides]AVQ86687.1 porin [Plesiomonas shigelloides]
MKRNVLAIVIPALLVSAASQAAEIYNKDNNKIDLYGRVVGLNYMSSDKAERGDQSYARFGIRGETQINDSLKGIGLFEYNLPASGDNEVRYAYAGLQHDIYGGISYGRQDGLMTIVNDYTDILPEFGGDGLGKESDSFGTGRTDGVLKYLIQSNGFIGGLQYTTETEETDYSGTGNGYAAALGYEFADTGFGSFGGAVTYTNAKKTDVQSGADFGGDKDAQITALGLKYKYGNIYAAMTYSEGRDNFKGNNLTGNTGYFNKMRGYEAVVQYQGKIEPSIAYIRTDVKDNGMNINDTYNEYVDIGATYYMNDNFRVYADYKINLLDENQFTKANELTTDDVFAVGLRYDF